MTENEKQLLLAEYQPLREEVNRTVDRMTTNELASSAFVFSIIVFQLTAEIPTRIPDWIVYPLGALLAMVAAFAGYERSKVFRRHMEQVDNYLSSLERKFSSGYGWTNHYQKTMDKSALTRQEISRKFFWHILRFVALLNFVLQIGMICMSSTQM